MSNVFEPYVKDYREIINRGAAITGEHYEYFLQLRIQLLKNKIQSKIAQKNRLNILDFGCGTGITETFLRSFFPSATIYGVDTSRDSIKEAKKLNVENTFFLNTECLSEEFKDGFFDLIYSNGTLHYLSIIAQQAVLEKLFSVLNSDGDMFILKTILSTR
jgi:trans-aconitate methyltransferase